VRSAHLIIGWLGVVVFLGTGQFMRMRFPDVYVDDEALRYIYRANHVYVLLASLVNIVLGMYCKVSDRPWRVWAARVGSILVMASPIILVLAFFIEAPNVTPDRVLTLLGVIALGAGVLGHVVGYRETGRM
jgi:drug/metabolite transporter (DMT)-like permease